MELAILASLILIFLSEESNAANFPASFPRCRKSDPNFDECLTDAIQVSLNIAMEKGIPEVKIPNLKNYVVPEIVVDTRGTNVKIMQKYNDVKLLGISDSVYSNAHLDLDKKVLSFTQFMPNASQISSYVVKGKILLLTVNGHGTALFSALNSSIDHTITFKERSSKSEIFFEVASYTLKWEIQGKLICDMDNLFDGNKEISDNMLKVINENWRDVWNDARSGLEETYAAVFMDLAQKFFSAFPINQIFLD